jgi:hypothetical protein
MMSASGWGNLENGHGVIVVPTPSPRDGLIGPVPVELGLGNLNGLPRPARLGQAQEKSHLPG